MLSLCTVLWIFSSGPCSTWWGRLPTRPFLGGSAGSVLLVFLKACSLLRHSIGTHTYELSGPAEVRIPGLLQLHNSRSLRVPLATGLFSDIWGQGGGDRVHCWTTPVCFCAGLGWTDINNLSCSPPFLLRQGLTEPGVPEFSQTV